MKFVKDVMTSGVRTLSPQDTMALAAQAMDELDVGVLPVCDGQRVVGMVTDRDIVVRGVAQELAPATTLLEDVMSPQVEWVFEDEGLEDATVKMQQLQIRRLPVLVCVGYAESCPRFSRPAKHVPGSGAVRGLQASQ